MNRKHSFANLAVWALVFAILVFVACQKGDSASGVKTLQVFLTDAPAAFDAVNIYIKAVEAKIDTAERHRHDDHYGDDDHDEDDRESGHDDYGSWTSLNARTGVFNVLALRNGIDTLLATGSVNGTVRKIRITLGANNTVVKDGVTYPLVLANETQNYLYIRLHEEHHRDSAEHMGVWIDFDISRSIVLLNGTYYLMPKLKPFCDDNFAEVEGKVTPVDAATVVKVYHSTDTATAIPNPDGRFKVRGLAAGTYTVWFDAANGYVDTTINNVQLSTGREVRLPDVVLKK